MKDSPDHTPAGWPFLTEDHYIDVLAPYTLELADKLQNGEAAVPRAENAATAAESAHIAAELARNGLPLVATGQTSISVPSSGGTTTIDLSHLTLPTVPQLLVEVIGPVVVTAHITALTETTATIKLRNSSTRSESVIVQWTAIGSAQWLTPGTIGDVSNLIARLDALEATVWGT